MFYLLIFILIVLIILLFYLSRFVYYKILASIKGAPYAGTSDDKLEKIFELADIQNGNQVVDLGSGDGRILIGAAIINNKAKYYGYEIDPFFYKKSIKKIKKLGLQKNIKILRKDFFKEDLGRFDIIIVFLIPYQMDQLEKKLKKELKDRAKVISYGFEFKNWKYIKKSNNMYLYQK